MSLEDVAHLLFVIEPINYALLAKMPFLNPSVWVRVCRQLDISADEAALFQLLGDDNYRINGKKSYRALCKQIVEQRWKHCCVLLLNRCPSVGSANALFQICISKDADWAWRLISENWSNNTVLWPRTIEIVESFGCMSHDTWVQTSDGEQLRVRDIHAGQQLRDYFGQPVMLERVIALKTPSINFVRIGASALGHEQPRCDVRLVAGNSPILYKDTETYCHALLSQRLPGVTKECSRPERVYTLVTQRRTFVDVSGLPVGTWALRDWQLEHGADEDRLWHGQ